MAALRRQQEVVLALLQRGGGSLDVRSMDKEAWVALLRATGLDDDDMRRWHVEFERQAPEAHQEFLESLGIEAEEASQIRSQARDSVASG